MRVRAFAGLLHELILKAKKWARVLARGFILRMGLSMLKSHK
jgi:hypothetical protein